jgi:ribosome-binding factor A
MARGGRERRMGEEIQRLLPDLIREEVKDPRVSGMVTITAVDVTSDLSLAKVFVTVLNPAEGIDATVAGLNGCSAFLRSQLSHTMRVRTVPALRFTYDESVERGMRLTRLIESAVRSDPGKSRRKKPGGA